MQRLYTLPHGDGQDVDGHAGRPLPQIRLSRVPPSRFAVTMTPVPELQTCQTVSEPEIGHLTNFQILHTGDATAPVFLYHGIWAWPLSK